jgi:4-amino-4-deoxy-L-arabinose transferase-like glycosyltransferase
MLNFSAPLPWQKSLWVIIAVAIAIAFIGIAWLPIEAHEAFVLLAAQHMLDSGDWVIPYFNAEPHLTKPPLNYWLTMLVSWLSNGGHVEAWHGRLISGVAGVGMVAMTAYAGRKLFDEGIGLLSAIILATCSGYFYYTHSARPEVLYAFWCNLAFMAYLPLRGNAVPPHKERLLTYGIWVSFALATLTKGPHVPAILLLAFVIDKYWQGNSLKQAMLGLRPLSGVILGIAIVLPWWWLLHHRLGGSGLHGTQLSGSLLTLNVLKLLSPYYLFRPLQLLLPWLLFLPALVLIFRKTEYKNQIKLLILLIALPALILSFGPQKRWYYMLPALLPMSIMLAAAVMTYVRNRPVNSLVPKLLPGFALLSALLFIVAGSAQWPWGSERFSQAELAQSINSHYTSNTRLLTWEVTPEIYTFYSRRIIGRIYGAEDIPALLKEDSSRNLMLILQTKNLKQLADDLRDKNLQVTILGQTKGGDSENVPTTLVSINTAR